MGKRLIVAIPLIAIVILALALPGLPGAIFFMLMALLLSFGAIHESYALVNCSAPGAYKDLTLLYSIATILTAFNSWRLDASQPELYGCALCTAAVILAILVILIHHAPTRENLSDAALAVFIAGAFIWPLLHLPRIYFFTPSTGFSGRWLLGYVIIVTKVADIGAYLLGSATARLPGGNHKLSKLVSPKKSYEGLAGGIIFSLIASILFWKFAGDHLTPLHFPDILLIGLVAPVIGLWGDLSESVLKRVANQKDSGKLPGLGGVLDFLDSLIPMGMVVYYWILLRG